MSKNKTFASEKCCLVEEWSTKVCRFVFWKRRKEGDHWRGTDDAQRRERGGKGQTKREREQEGDTIVNRHIMIN